MSEYYNDYSDSQFIKDWNILREKAKQKELITGIFCSPEEDIWSVVLQDFDGHRVLVTDPMVLSAAIDDSVKFIDQMK